MTVRKVVAAGSLAATTLIGGAIGATIVGSADAAPTPNPTPSTATGSNENPGHESGETAQRETDEKNGTAHFGGPGGMRGSNENPGHESGESSQREAQESQNATPSGGVAPTGGTRL